MGTKFNITCIILFCFSFLSSYSCKKNPQYVIPILKQKAPATYGKDSTYIACYYYNLANIYKTVSWFESGRFFDLDTTNELPRFIVDTILYSPDLKKLYALLYIEYDTSLIDDISQPYYKDFNGKSLFDGRGIIGYRDSTAEPWKLFEYSKLISIAFFSYDNIKSGSRKYYFEKIKDDSFLHSIVGESLKDKKLNYNIDDSGFWTSFIWQKGLLKNGYYNFELEYDGMNSSTRIINMPEISECWVK